MCANGEGQIDFCTLGMFIIDEIHFPPPTPSVTDVLGGAGSYSALGARLFAAPPKSKAVGWIVDAGSDFPTGIRDLIESWNTSCLIRHTPERLTTRGWNEYGEDDYRAFHYMTPKLRLDCDSLTPQLLKSKSFHLICSPTRCITLVNDILARRKELLDWMDHIDPCFIWEPVPDMCRPENLDDCFKALTHVDVVSPNHAELCSFFEAAPTTDTGSIYQSVESYSHRWLSAGIGRSGSGAVVVRAGKEGCYIASRDQAKWLPAYHKNTPTKVVDPTGGGNTFLGGLAMGMVNGRQASYMSNVEEAAKWGSVAASFAIEQVGLPSLGQSKGGETWNGETVFGRLSFYEEQLKTYEQP